MTRLFPVAAVAVVLALAGCRSAASSASTPATSPATTEAPAATQPAVTSPPAAKAPSSGLANVTIGVVPGAPAGPERLTFTSCGKLSSAQQDQFGTNAGAGLTYKFVNQANFAAAPQVSVNFLEGTMVVASNVSGAGTTPVAGGDSESGEVDAVGASGQPVTFDRCEVTGYMLLPSGSGNTQYAG